MKCSRCRHLCGDEELKIIDGTRLCTTCISTQIDEAFAPRARRQRSRTASAKQAKRTARLGRIEFTFVTLILWLLLPAIVQFVVVTFLHYPVTLQLLSRSQVEWLQGFQPLLILPREQGVYAHYNVIALWFIQIPLSMLYADGRIKDIGWQPWLSLVLGLPILNLLLCVWPGQDTKNAYGEPTKQAPLSKRLLVYSSPISLPLILLGIGLGLYHAG